MNGQSGLSQEFHGPEAAAYARDAFRRFGNGAGKPGALNYGECLPYAVAVAMESVLLFKGTVFSRTDVAVGEC